jgi:hypothetical protein
MATPEEVANDMLAWAKHYDGRDNGLACVCRDAARLIRQMLCGQTVDGRTYNGVLTRLTNAGSLRSHANDQILTSLSRARHTLTRLRSHSLGPGRDI